MSTQNKTSNGEQKTIFVTGATGFIGRVVVEKAVAKGYNVRGLSRSEEGDARLKSLGATAVRGDLTTLDVLERESANADMVFHLAFIHDFTRDFDEVLRFETAAVDALSEPLRGTNKPLVISSGCAMFGSDPKHDETTEDSDFPASETFALHKRINAEQHALAKANDGVQVSVIRLAPYVYGRGGGFTLPALMQIAAKVRKSIYVDDGSIRTSAVHVDDAAELYFLMAKGAKAGEAFNCTGSTTITLKAMAEAIGELLNVPVQSVSHEEAAKIWTPFLVAFVQHENRASSRKAIKQLGWQPKGVDMLTDVRSGTYTEVAKNML